jgi:hypothetical protein
MVIFTIIINKAGIYPGKKEISRVDFDHRVT